MMYHPFRQFEFDPKVCFLTGQAAIQKVPVFPTWLSRRFQLDEKPLKMLDEQILSYTDIQVPVSARALEALKALENEVESAFTGGYTALKQLSPLRLFQWIARQVYGMIYFEIQLGIRQQARSGESLNFSQGLMHKFGNLHAMLQSLVLPLEFEGLQAWTIHLFPVQNEPETFIYRDEINTLAFSLRMADFGIIACLQDNGESSQYHAALLKKTSGQVLTPIQFEELCARFFYSAYLFNRLPEYSIIEAHGTTYIEPMNLRIGSKPVYDAWQNKTYAQVLETFWKPWGHSLFEILKDPDQPLSFL